MQRALAAETSSDTETTEGPQLKLPALSALKRNEEKYEDDNNRERSFSARSYDYATSASNRGGIRTRKNQASRSTVGSPQMSSHAGRQPVYVSDSKREGGGREEEEDDREEQHPHLQHLPSMLSRAPTLSSLHEEYSPKRPYREGEEGQRGDEGEDPAVLENEGEEERGKEEEERDALLDEMETTLADINQRMARFEQEVQKHLHLAKKQDAKGGFSAQTTSNTSFLRRDSKDRAFLLPQISVRSDISSFQGQLERRDTRPSNNNNDTDADEDIGESQPEVLGEDLRVSAASASIFTPKDVRTKARKDLEKELYRNRIQRVRKSYTRSQLASLQSNLEVIERRRSQGSLALLLSSRPETAASYMTSATSSLEGGGVDTIERGADTTNSPPSEHLRAIATPYDEHAMISSFDNYEEFHHMKMMQAAVQQDVEDEFDSYLKEYRRQKMLASFSARIQAWFRMLKARRVFLRRRRKRRLLLKDMFSRFTFLTKAQRISVHAMHRKVLRVWRMITESNQSERRELNNLLDLAITRSRLKNRLDWVLNIFLTDRREFEIVQGWRKSVTRSFLDKSRDEYLRLMEQSKLLSLVFLFQTWKTHVEDVLTKRREGVIQLGRAAQRIFFVKTMWPTERVSIAFEMWRRWSVYKKFKKEEKRKMEERTEEKRQSQYQQLLKMMDPELSQDPYLTSLPSSYYGLAGLLSGVSDAVISMETGSGFGGKLKRAEGQLNTSLTAEGQESSVAEPKKEAASSPAILQSPSAAAPVVASAAAAAVVAATDSNKTTMEAPPVLSIAAVRAPKTQPPSSAGTDGSSLGIEAEVVVPHHRPLSNSLGASTDLLFPVFAIHLKEWETFVLLTQDRRKRAAMAAKMCPTAKLRRRLRRLHLFVEKKRIKEYKLQMAREYYLKRLYVRVLKEWSRFCRARGRVKRLFTRCFQSWKEWTPKALKTRKTRESIEAAHRKIMVRDLWLRWRDRLTGRTSLRLFTTQSLLQPSIKSQLCAISLSLWSDRELDATFLASWRAMRIHMQRRRLWLYFIMQHQRLIGLQLKLATFRHWQYAVKNKLVTRQDPDSDDEDERGEESMTMRSGMTFASVARKRIMMHLIPKAAQEQLDRLPMLYSISAESTEKAKQRYNELKAAPLDLDILQNAQRDEKVAMVFTFLSNSNLDVTFQTESDLVIQIKETPATAGLRKMRESPQSLLRANPVLYLPPIPSASTAASLPGAPTGSSSEANPEVTTPPPPQGEVPETNTPPQTPAIDANVQSMNNLSAALESLGRYLQVPEPICAFNECIENTSLHDAADLRDIQKLQDLIICGSEVNVVNEEGDSALHFASRHYHESYVPVIIHLLEAGADATLPNKAGYRPVDLATNPLVKMILESHVSRLQSLNFSGKEKLWFLVNQRLQYETVGTQSLWRILIALRLSKELKELKVLAQDFLKPPITGRVGYDTARTSRTVTTARLTARGGLKSTLKDLSKAILTVGKVGQMFITPDNSPEFQAFASKHLIGEKRKKDDMKLAWEYCSSRRPMTFRALQSLASELDLLCRAHHAEVMKRWDKQKSIITEMVLKRSKEEMKSAPRAAQHDERGGKGGASPSKKKKKKFKKGGEDEGDEFIRKFQRDYEIADVPLSPSASTSATSPPSKGKGSKGQHSSKGNRGKGSEGGRSPTSAQAQGGSNFRARAGTSRGGHSPIAALKPKKEGEAAASPGIAEQALIPITIHVFPPRLRHLEKYNRLELQFSSAEDVQKTIETIRKNVEISKLRPTYRLPENLFSDFLPNKDKPFTFPRFTGVEGNEENYNSRKLIQFLLDSGAASSKVARERDLWVLKAFESLSLLPQLKKEIGWYRRKLTLLVEQRKQILEGLSILKTQIKEAESQTIENATLLASTSVLAEQVKNLESAIAKTQSLLLEKRDELARASQKLELFVLEYEKAQQKFAQVSTGSNFKDIDYWRNECDAAYLARSKAEFELQKKQSELNDITRDLARTEVEHRDKTRNLRRITAQHMTVLQGLSDRKELIKLRFKHEVEQFETLGRVGQSLKRGAEEVKEDMLRRAQLGLKYRSVFKCFDMVIDARERGVLPDLNLHFPLSPDFRTEEEGGEEGYGSAEDSSGRGAKRTLQKGSRNAQKYVKRTSMSSFGSQRSHGSASNDSEHLIGQGRGPGTRKRQSSKGELDSESDTTSVSSGYSSVNSKGRQSLQSGGSGPTGNFAANKRRVKGATVVIRWGAASHSPNKRRGRETTSPPKDNSSPSGRRTSTMGGGPGSPGGTSRSRGAGGNTPVSSESTLSRFERLYQRSANLLFRDIRKDVATKHKSTEQKSFVLGSGPPTSRDRSYSISKDSATDLLDYQELVNLGDLVALEEKDEIEQKENRKLKDLESIIHGYRRARAKRGYAPRSAEQEQEEEEEEGQQEAKAKTGSKPDARADENATSGSKESSVDAYFYGNLGTSDPASPSRRIAGAKPYYAEATSSVSVDKPTTVLTPPPKPGLSPVKASSVTSTAAEAEAMWRLQVPVETTPPSVSASPRSPSILMAQGTPRLQPRPHSPSSTGSSQAGRRSIRPDKERSPRAAQEGVMSGAVSSARAMSQVVKALAPGSSRPVTFDNAPDAVVKGGRPFGSRIGGSFQVQVARGSFSSGMIVGGPGETHSGHSMRSGSVSSATSAASSASSGSSSSEDSEHERPSSPRKEGETETPPQDARRSPATPNASPGSVASASAKMIGGKLFKPGSLIRTPSQRSLHSPLSPASDRISRASRQDSYRPSTVGNTIQGSAPATAPAPAPEQLRIVEKFSQQEEGKQQSGFLSLLNRSSSFKKMSTLGRKPSESRMTEMLRSRSSQNVASGSENPTLLPTIIATKVLDDINTSSISSTPASTAPAPTPAPVPPPPYDAGTADTVSHRQSMGQEIKRDIGTAGGMSLPSVDDMMDDIGLQESNTSRGNELMNKLGVSQEEERFVELDNAVFKEVDNALKRVSSGLHGTFTAGTVLDIKDESGPATSKVPASPGAKKKRESNASLGVASVNFDLPETDTMGVFDDDNDSNDGHGHPSAVHRHAKKREMDARAFLSVIGSHIAPPAKQEEERSSTSDAPQKNPKAAALGSPAATGPPTFRRREKTDFGLSPDAATAPLPSAEASAAVVAAAAKAVVGGKTSIIQAAEEAVLIVNNDLRKASQISGGSSPVRRQSAQTHVSLLKAAMEAESLRNNELQDLHIEGISKSPLKAAASFAPASSSPPSASPSRRNSAISSNASGKGIEVTEAQRSPVAGDAVGNSEGTFLSALTGNPPLEKTEAVSAGQTEPRQEERTALKELHTAMPLLKLDIIETEKANELLQREKTVEDILRGTIVVGQVGSPKKLLKHSETPSDGASLNSDGGTAVGNHNIGGTVGEFRSSSIAASQLPIVFEGTVQRHDSLHSSVSPNKGALNRKNSLNSQFSRLSDIVFTDNSTSGQSSNKVETLDASAQLSSATKGLGEGLSLKVSSISSNQKEVEKKQTDYVSNEVQKLLEGLQTGEKAEERRQRVWESFIRQGQTEAEKAAYAELYPDLYGSSSPSRGAIEAARQQAISEKERAAREKKLQQEQTREQILKARGKTNQKGTNKVSAESLRAQEEKAAEEARAAAIMQEARALIEKAREQIHPGSSRKTQRTPGRSGPSVSTLEFPTEQSSKGLSTAQRKKTAKRSTDSSSASLSSTDIRTSGKRKSFQSASEGK